jgi:hypothetical protein
MEKDGAGRAIEGLGKANIYTLSVSKLLSPLTF